VQVVIVGREGAGKSSLLFDLTVGVNVHTNEEFIVEQFYCREREFIITNLGGVDFREKWPEYLAKAQLLVYVLDSSGGPQKFKPAKEDLERILKHPSVRKGIPLVVCANKADLETADSIEKITEYFQLNKITDRKWQIFPTAVINSHHITEQLLELLSLGSPHSDVNHLICEYAVPLTGLETAFDWFINSGFK